MDSILWLTEVRPPPVVLASLVAAFLLGTMATYPWLLRRGNQKSWDRSRIVLVMHVWAGLCFFVLVFLIFWALPFSESETRWGLLAIMTLALPLMIGVLVASDFIYRRCCSQG